MTKLQILFTASCVALFGLLYFGLDTKPSSFKEIERTRALSSSSMDIESSIIKALGNLSESQRIELSSLDELVSNSENENAKTEALKKVSGFWYKAQRHDISGHYAGLIAEAENTADAWNIAGSTYSLGMQVFDEGPEWDYCYDGAIAAFQNAISLDPEYVDSRINLALCYVERAPEDNPMKGILMLVDLNKKHPENVGVLVNLGKLALRTNQLDRARERFETVIELDKNNRIANCYLSEVYKGLGDIANANKYSALCDNL